MTKLHSKIKYISSNTIGDTDGNYVEKRLQEAQIKKRFKDAGKRIGGSAKEMAAWRSFITLSDLNVLEQDAVTAYEMVVKDKVWAKVDAEQEKQNGVESGVAFLKRELRSAYAGKPKQKTPEMRKSYVVFASYVQAEFTKIKTFQDMLDYSEKIYKLSMMDAVKIYLPDEVHLFENTPEAALLLKRKYSEWHIRQMLKTIVGKEFYNLLFRLNSEAAILKWRSAKKYTENNNWTWADKKAIERGEQSEIKINSGLPLAYIKRTGGLAITDVSEKFIINTLGFKYLEFGNYVRDKEANEHLRHFIGAYVDLCDVLNINAKQITQLNNLSIAFGSRGHAGAMAFYQPSRQIIALTKQRGDGTVAHEWFHYLDHLVYKNIGRPGAEHPLYSDSGLNIVDDRFKKTKYNFENIIRYIERAEYYEFIEWQNGSAIATSKKVHVKPDIVLDKIKETYKSQSTQRFKIDTLDTVDETIAALKHKYPFYFRYANYRKPNTKNVFGFLASKFNLPSVTIEMEADITSSAYYHFSSKMKSKYWIEKVELFARAFETYCYDKLIQKGRYNNYLVSGGYFNEPQNLYPIGKDREVLFMLFDNLFADLKSELQLKPFEGFTTIRTDEYINFDEKKDGQAISSGVIVEQNNVKPKTKALALEIELELLSI